jgi:hypothetical protein
VWADRKPVVLGCGRREWLKNGMNARIVDRLIRWSGLTIRKTHLTDKIGELIADCVKMVYDAGRDFC